MNKTVKKFRTFLENLRNGDNGNLINVIQAGYGEIYESLSTDDANEKKLGQAVATFGAPDEVTDITPNSDNEYFDQTLPNNLLAKAKESQAGKRTWEHPKAGKGASLKDPMNSQLGANQNTYGAQSDYPGGNTGGYDLGGPAQ